MRTKLITALRMAANKLESGEFAYEWSQPESCNCGVVACAIMGTSRQAMREKLWDARTKAISPQWKSMVGYFCPVTGAPEHEVFKALCEAGLTGRELIELEFMTNPVVLHKCQQLLARFTKPKPWHQRIFSHKKTVMTYQIAYTHKPNAIIYLRAWADLIQEQERDDAPAIERSQEAVATVA